MLGPAGLDLLIARTCSHMMWSVVSEISNCLRSRAPLFRILGDASEKLLYPPKLLRVICAPILPDFPFIPFWFVQGLVYFAMPGMPR
jgi:hypothetical protein